MIIGVTGQSGAGKGTVSEILEKKGFYHIDTDAVWHSIIDSCAPELEAAFGKVTDREGHVDRRVLGDIAFSSKGNTDKLNSVAHKAIMRRVAEIIAEKRSEGTESFTVDGAALFEAHAENICDRIITVTADEKDRMKRVTKRDGIDEARAAKRFSGQKDESYYTSGADFIIVNDNIGTLEAKINDILEKIKRGEDRK